MGRLSKPPENEMGSGEDPHKLLDIDYLVKLAFGLVVQRDSGYITQVEFKRDLLKYENDLSEKFGKLVQQERLKAKLEELKRAKMQGYISGELMHKTDRRIADLTKQLKEYES